MISISTTTANIDGNVIIHELPSSNITDQTARVSRVKTLDGDVVITHSGVVTGDRTLDIKCYPNDVDLLKIQAFFEDEVLVMVAFNRAVYLGVIESLKQKNTVNLTIFLKEKISS